MGGISESKMGTVRRLIEAVPDAHIRTLETALASVGGDGSNLSVVHDLVSAEVVERRIRSAVFAPVGPLCAPLAGVRPFFPAQAPALLWRALKAEAPEEVAQALRAGLSLRGDDESPPIFDDLCLRAAAGLAAGETDAYRAVTASLEATSPGVSGRMAQGLSLAPLARATLPRVAGWVRNLNSDNAAALRLAFRDATTVAEDAGPMFMELLFTHLEEPWHVLRLISALMDRPSDRYLASSELAGFGDRLMTDLDQRIDTVRRFNPDGGIEAGMAVCQAVLGATLEVAEFEQWIALAKDGPWGTRLTSQKRALALAVEGRLKEVEPAVVAALPSTPVRYGGKSMRATPKVTDDLNPAMITRAEALLAILDGTRASAAHGGFGSLRTKVMEALDGRLEHYAEDLIDLLHSGDGPSERLRDMLDTVASFLAMAKDPKAAELVRRRAAVA